MSEDGRLPDFASVWRLRFSRICFILSAGSSETRSASIGSSESGSFPVETGSWVTWVIDESTESANETTPFPFLDAEVKIDSKRLGGFWESSEASVTSSSGSSFATCLAPPKMVSSKLGFWACSDFFSTLFSSSSGADWALDWFADFWSDSDWLSDPKLTGISVTSAFVTFSALSKFSPKPEVDSIAPVVLVCETLELFDALLWLFSFSIILDISWEGSSFGEFFFSAFSLKNKFKILKGIVSILPAESEPFLYFLNS